MSRSSSKGKEVAEEPKSDNESSFSEEEEDESEDEQREETPDLYRNSALGIFTGEMDDIAFGQDDGEMDDVDDEEEVDEMDFDEQTDSETSDTEDDGEELADIPVDTADVDWIDEDEDADEEDDLVENEGEEDDEDEDEQEDHDDEQEDDDGPEVGIEMSWQDVHSPVPDPGNDEGDEEDTEPIPVVPDEEDDEQGMASDEEEFHTHHIDNGDMLRDIFGFTGGMPDGTGLFVPRRHRSTGDEGVQVFGRPRNGPAPPPETTTHPLLLDASGNAPRGVNSQSRSRTNQRLLPGASGSQLLNTIEELVNNGAVQLFQHIMTRGREGDIPHSFRLELPVGGLGNLGRPSMARNPRADRQPRQTVTPPQRRDLEPLLTLQRWGEEVKILNGDFVSERAMKLSNHVTVALLPAAIETAALEAKRKEEEAARLKDAEAKAAEETASAEKTVTEEVPPTSENNNSVDPSPDHPIDSANVSAPPTIPSNELHQSEDQPMQEATDPVMTDVDTEMADATIESAPPAIDTNTSQEGTSSSAQPADNSASASSSAPPQRVTVVIHGNEVDITDTGIDPTFLEALPDDMREEVLSQHVRDQRAARVQRPADSQISDEFLDALPPEIRAEIIQQEAMERARQTAHEPPANGGPAEIDPASFIASLDPTLRHAVLLESDAGFLQSLPSTMLAEAGVFGDLSHVRMRAPGRGARGTSRNQQGGTSAPKKSAPHHEAIQLLDKSGIAVLVRLLFFPQVLKKNLLFKVLVNLCENSKTRTELFNLVLRILQDGTGDLAAVDKSFSQLSVKNAKSPKSPGKQKSIDSEYFNIRPGSGAQGETVPDLITQRCLEALTFVVSANSSSSMFFLTETELPPGLRRTASKKDKGKGKEKQLPHSHYPIVLLLNLLGRQSLLRTTSIMESIVGLLATVTRPLAAIKDARKEETPASEEKANTGGAAPDVPQSATDAVTSAPAPAPTSLPVTDAGAQATEQPAVNAPVEIAKEDNVSPEIAQQQLLANNPPQIPHHVLRLIVNILTVGECSARTFQQSLALIQHLSNIPDARDAIAQELRAKAQEFGQQLIQNLDKLVVHLKEEQGDALIGSVASQFSTSSSEQAKLLRVLKTIDYMYSPKVTTSSAVESDGDTEKVQGIYESFRFSPLWKRLGDCLSTSEDETQAEHVATVLLPLIESLMVVCKYVGSKSAARTLRATTSPKLPTTPGESIEDLFVSFTDAHRKILNLMVRNNPSLMSGSFSLLVHNPRVLDFDNKRNYFNQQLHRRPHSREHHATLQLHVRRARVFEDSFQQLQRKTGDQIKYGKLSIRFIEEEGVDAGGLTREWFQILARQMFDPNNALFQPCAADKLTYQPNKNSWVNPEHLSFFKFVGRLIGKAIFDGRLLDAYFARSLYRQLLGKPVDYKDVEWVDPEYYNSLCWIMENDPTLLDLTFSVEADEFGVNRIFPLKEGGESIPVTQENKREFVQLSAQFRLYSSIKEQIENLSSGFYEIIPKDLITIFNEHELELLISGTPDIDVDEWRSATEYNGYTSSDPNIVWFWRALKSFTRDEKAKVLSFATGTSRVPLNGFGDLQGVQGVQKFSIHRAYGESDRLPQAHTCFNQIDLPQYSSYEKLRQQLLLAINEGGEGFGFV